MDAIRISFYSTIAGNALKAEFPKCVGEVCAQFPEQGIRVREVKWAVLGRCCIAKRYDNEISPLHAKGGELLKLLWGNQKMLREYGEGVTIKNGEKNLPYPGLGLE